MTDLTTTAAPPVGAATDHHMRGTGARGGAGAPHAAGAHSTGEHHHGN